MIKNAGISVHVPTPVSEITELAQADVSYINAGKRQATGACEDMVSSESDATWSGVSVMRTSAARHHWQHGRTEAW